ELALLCVRMFPKELEKIERYISGLPDMIHESVVASRPKTMQEAIEIATELMDKKIHPLLLNDRVRTKESKIISNNNNRIRGRTLPELMLQGLVRRNLTKDLNLCAQNATITMTDNVLQNATSAKELAIWLMTVGVLQMPMLLTIRGALGQVKNLLAMNVEP
ncbi:hypothetical protein Tco_0310591, partial [Tanacetum coccineum]